MVREREREVAATPRPRCRFESLGLDVLIAGAVIVVLSSPVLFTNRVFAVDTTNALWMGSIMRQSLSHGVPPSFFINTGRVPLSGVFNPLFAFYGGPLFAVFGALIAIVGMGAAYIVLVVLSFAAAYGGSLWISRQAGLRGLLAHAPAFAVVSSAYYLTNLYGRGDIPEFVALSVIPLFIASAVHEVRAPRSTAGPTVLLVVSVFFFTGSHNLTLLWGTLIGVASLVVLAAFVRPRGVSLRRLSIVVGIVAFATMVNGWFLLPDVAFGGTTQAVGTLVPLYASLDRFSVLFYPGRAVPPRENGTPALYVQAPIYFLLWSLVCGAWISKSGRMPLLRRVWTALVLLLVGVFLLIMITPFWGWAPLTLRSIQFPYRLNGYVLLFVAGLVLVSLLAVQGELVRRRGPRLAAALLVALAPVVAISSGLAVWQIWVPTSCANHYCVANRSAGRTPPYVQPSTWYSGTFYADATARVIQPRRGRLYFFDPKDVDAHGDKLAMMIDPPAGTEPFLTNIMGGPQLVAIRGGVERVGRSSGGFAVLRRKVPGSGPVPVVIQTASSPAIRIGRVVSLAGVIGLAGLLIRLLLAGRRRRSLAEPYQSRQMRRAAEPGRR